MAKNVVYNIDTMNSQGNKLVSLAGSMETEAQKIATAIGGLSGEWEGQEYEAFLQEYEQFKTIQTNFINAIRGFGTYIKNLATEAETKDTQGKSRVQTLIDSK